MERLGESGECCRCGSESEWWAETGQPPGSLACLGWEWMDVAATCGRPRLRETQPYPRSPRSLTRAYGKVRYCGMADAQLGMDGRYLGYQVDTVQVFECENYRFLGWYGEGCIHGSPLRRIEAPRGCRGGLAGDTRWRLRAPQFAQPQPGLDFRGARGAVPVERDLTICQFAAISPPPLHPTRNNISLKFLLKFLPRSRYSN